MTGPPAITMRGELLLRASGFGEFAFSIRGKLRGGAPMLNIPTTAMVSLVFIRSDAKQCCTFGAVNLDTTRGGNKIEGVHL
jgi:hypothetical protein